ncbi:MAG: class I SAM-dependent methyltransferase [Rhodospirillales bacterium]
MNKTDLLKEYYDSNAAVYDVKHGVVLPGQAYNFKTYYEPFLNSHVPKQGRVLELGCGTGVYTQWLHNRGLDVVALDISDKMIAAARQRCPHAIYLQADCERPDIDLKKSGMDSPFDAVIGINTFSYYSQKSEALSAYRSLLNKDGQFIVIDMNGSSPYYFLMSLIGFNEMRQWFPEVRQFQRSEMAKMLNATGFSVQESQRFAFIPNKVNQHLVSLCAPFDAALHKMRCFDWAAMRFALVAQKT